MTRLLLTFGLSGAGVAAVSFAVWKVLPQVSRSVLKRNLLSYFSGLLGFLFILVFVVAASFCAFNPQFFTNNLATLDQLTAAFPYLLLFIIPAITMTAWADEKRQGTDELLFTLPGTDGQILLGKYLSLVCVYTVALAFSLFQLGVLGWYADPDWGLLLTTYFGYWLAGAALISLGMFASVLTSSVTVAFVVGAVICSVPVFIGEFGTSRPLIDNPTFVDSALDGISRQCLAFSLPERLREFTMGIVPLSGIVYFASMIVFALYLNAGLIGRRHWVQETGGMPMGGHFSIRVICLYIAIVAGNSVSTAASEWMGLRADLTEEDLYTLSDTTRELIGKIEKENPVTIQAFLSPEVPREHVAQHARLRGLLRQYDQIGGPNVELREVEVTPYSEEAEEASHFGITPTVVMSEQGGRFQQVEVFMGAVIQSPYDQVVIPFFEGGTSVEYELTRSIRTVSQKDRLSVAILRTDAKVNGGFDMSSMRSSPEWRVSRELKKQYNVTEVTADSPMDGEGYDVLIAALPSALNQQQMDNFVAFVKTGKPVLILDDPLPMVDPRNSPSQPKPRQGGGGGMFGQQGPPPEPRGNYEPLLKALGIQWQRDSMVWDQTNPHPQFVDLPKDYVFITPLSENPNAFNPKSDVTSGLQELLLIFSGEIKQDLSSGLDFESLLQTGAKSGAVEWGDVMENSFFGMQPKPSRMIVRDEDELAHVVAARIQGDKDGSKVNAIFVADVDFISDQMFNIAQNEMHGLKLDNVKFVLNCVDVLAGDLSYVKLRKRRSKHRALSEIQRQADAFRSENADQKKEAEEAAEKEKERLQEELDKEVAEIESATNLSRMEKEQQKRIAQQKKSRELTVKEANIDKDKDKKLEQLRAREQRQIRKLEEEIRLWAVVIPPLPALALAIVILVMRMKAESRDIEQARRRSE